MRRKAESTGTRRAGNVLITFFGSGGPMLLVVANRIANFAYAFTTRHRGTGSGSGTMLDATTSLNVSNYIAANTHPDHDTIAAFRKRILGQLQPLFVRVPLSAKTLGFSEDGQDQLGLEQDGSQCVQAHSPQLGPRHRIGTTVEKGSGLVEGDG